MSLTRCLLSLPLTHSYSVLISLSRPLSHYKCFSLSMYLFLSHSTKRSLPLYFSESVSHSHYLSIFLLVSPLLSNINLPLSTSFFYLVSSGSMKIQVPSPPDYDIYHQQRAEPHLVSLPLSLLILCRT